MTTGAAIQDRRRAWTLGCGSLAVPVLGLVALAWMGPGSLGSSALVLLALVALVGYYSVGLTAIVRRTGLGRGPLVRQELLLRSWVARFAKDPEGIWIHWAEQVSDAELGLGCLERAAPLGPRGAFELGLAYSEGPAKDLAIPWFRAAAERGHAGAMVHLAESLRWALDGVRDPEEAARWQHRAAASGRAVRRAHSVLRGREEAAGRALAEVDDWLDALWARPWMPWLSLVAFLFLLPRIGAYLAFYTLICAPLMWIPLRFINGPNRKLKGSLGRLVARAEAGDAKAASELACFYLAGGHGLPKDPMSAQVWFRRAAEGGDVESMVSLADMLASGHGCLRDAAQARAWYEAAAQAGHGRARVWLERPQDPIP